MPAPDFLTTAERWPDPVQGPWLLQFHWARVDGRLECVGLDVRSFRGGDGDKPKRPLPGGLQPVTTGLLRSMNATELIDAARPTARALLGEIEATGRPAAKKAAKRLRSAAEPERDAKPRRGRPPLPDAHYEAVAAGYRKAYDESRAPTQAVADEWGVARRTAGHWIAECRRRGLLGETEERKAGGVVPPKRRRKR